MKKQGGWVLRFVWGEINKIAPKMKLDPMQYKFKLGYEVLGRADGSISNMSPMEFIEIHRRLEADAKTLNIPFGKDVKLAATQKTLDQEVIKEKNLTPSPSPTERGVKKEL